MTEEYNLIWEEAKLAMKRGAICEKFSKYGVLTYRYKEKLELLADDDDWKNCLVINNDEKREGKWRITELTDCKIKYHINTEDYCAICHTHYTRALHAKTMDDCDNIISVNCIEEFTQILKSDIIKIRQEEYKKTGRDILKKIYCSPSLELNMIMYTENLPLLTKSQIHILEKMQHHKMNHDLDSERYIIGHRVGKGGMFDEPIKLEPGKHLIVEETLHTGEVIRKFVKIQEKEMHDKKDLDTEVSFIEAVKMMEAGKFFKSTSNKDIFSICYSLDSYLRVWDKSSNKWVKAGCILSFYMDMTFIEVEDPEKAEKKEFDVDFNELGLRENRSEFIMTNSACFGSEYINFCGIQQIINWEKAITTFMRLKSHHFVASVNSIEQYLVIMNADNLISIESWRGLPYKLTSLSPVFNIREDAEKAISDIGEENLKHMFYTLSGMYDKI